MLEGRLYFVDLEFHILAEIVETEMLGRCDRYCVATNSLNRDQIKGWMLLRVGWLLS